VIQEREKWKLFTSQGSEPLRDTVLILIVSIQFYECIALDRESTYPLETFFGFVRMDSNDVNIAERITASIVHTHVVKEALRVLELDEHVPDRANLAGVRLTGSLPPTGSHMMS
jgi:hypothetical protein